MTTSKQDKLPSDLIVLSDLHLGEGLLGGTPRYAPTEDFFHDEAFSRFLEDRAAAYRDDPSRLALVLNGDVFDFLTVTRVPDAETARGRGIVLGAAERQFGLNPTAVKSVFKLDVIYRGHRRFFKALAGFVARGHRVEILRGNHDLELYFEVVRDRLLEILAECHPGLDRETVAERVRFHEWFYLEPGRVFIEHGNQYDPTNSIRYPLHPLLARRSWWSVEKDEVLDYPLGSIFVRFFYNRVRRLDPYTPRLVSFGQYLDFVRSYNVFDVWRVYRDHYPHFVAALGPSTTGGSAGSTQEDDSRQEEEFRRLEERTRYGEIYRGLSDLKLSPVSASKPYVVKEMFGAVIRRAARLFLFVFVLLSLWFGVLEFIDLIPWATAKPMLLSLFIVLSLMGALSAWIHLDRKRKRRSGVSSRETLVERAGRIADLTDAKIVLMGHTHLVDYQTLKDGKAVYANSGTWTSVDNPWRRLMRDARRQTFLEVRGDAVRPRRWNDDAGRVDDVPLFHLEEMDLPERDTLLPGGAEVYEGEHSWLPSVRVPGDDESE